jgi:hypothetical protein
MEYAPFDAASPIVVVNPTTTDVAFWPRGNDAVVKRLVETLRWIAPVFSIWQALACSRMVGRVERFFERETAKFF